MCIELRELEEKDPVKDPNKVEPRKWPIHNSNFIMMKLGGYDKKIIENIKLLAQIDPLRTNYYLDFGRKVLGSLSMGELKEELNQILNNM
jgi:hypothetical protein